MFLLTSPPPALQVFALAPIYTWPECLPFVWERFLHRLIDQFRILGIGLKLACNGGSCGGISLNRDLCHLHLKRLRASASVAS